MRSAAIGLGPLALASLYWAFRMGLHWHDPEALRRLWIDVGLGTGAAVLGWLLWSGLSTLYGRLVLRFEKGQALERAYVVAYLQHHATRCDSRTQSALEVMADDIRLGRHRTSGGAP